MSRKGNKRYTDLINLSNEEISRRAHDKQLPVNQRRRYQQEEKNRKLRNRQKRRSE